MEEITEMTSIEKKALEAMRASGKQKITGYSREIEGYQYNRREFALKKSELPESEYPVREVFFNKKSLIGKELRDRLLNSRLQKINEIAEKNGAIWDDGILTINDWPVFNINRIGEHQSIWSDLFSCFLYDIENAKNNEATSFCWDRD